MKLDAATRHFLEIDGLNKATSEMEFRRIDHSTYPVGLIMLIAFSGVAVGLQSWNDIADFADSKIELLRKYYPNLKKTPSHDTLRRFFSLVDYSKLESYYREWAARIYHRLHPESVEDDRPEKERWMHPLQKKCNHIAIDGKTMRGATTRIVEKPSNTKGLGVVKELRTHIVTAFCTELGISLGQEKVEAKSNEITAIPKLLETLSICAGDIVTIDAMGTQTAIAEAIVKKGADYILPVKGNHPALQKSIQEAMKPDMARLRNRNDFAEAKVVGHGRTAEYECYLSVEPACLGQIHRKWSGMRSFGVIYTKRKDIKTGKTTTEETYFISTLGRDAQTILNYKRAHWAIENKLHWVLDVVFNEDDDRKKMNSALSYSLVRKLVIAHARSIGINSRLESTLKKLAWRNSELEKFLDGFIESFAKKELTESQNK